LLLSGADASLRDSAGVSPIDLAVDHSQDEIVVALAQKGVELEGVDEPPMVRAVRQNHFSTVRVLLAVGADANPVLDYADGTTMLHFAAETDNAAAIPALVEAGANVESADLQDETPLFSAATHGSCASMRALLQLGVDIDAK
ncbi:unnamed protein product, partial [Ectocarpus sp. 12 AP-2014]